jgi:hypothetical protein
MKLRKQKTLAQVERFFGGPEGIRTPDLCRDRAAC